jgi:hypothetical protein
MTTPPTSGPWPRRRRRLRRRSPASSGDRIRIVGSIHDAISSCQLDARVRTCGFFSTPHVDWSIHQAKLHACMHAAVNIYIPCTPLLYCFFCCLLARVASSYI